MEFDIELPHLRNMNKHASISEPIYSEIHYYDLYQPTRAYHISHQLTNVKNIYAKEETENY